MIHGCGLEFGKRISDKAKTELSACWETFDQVLKVDTNASPESTPQYTAVKGSQFWFPA